ncbi:hypothetical protein [Lentilitoribacter sp. EG35]|uniref:hypothetical protein n=1 Tax=Lentilitoribacter sp. EG35 TaxID=3234192 RepID=UPI00346146BC
MIRPLYNWPDVLIPRRAIIVAPSNTVNGLISLNGYENNIPISGARNQMMMEFGMRPSSMGNIFAWLCNQARGALFSVPVWNSPQLATNATIAANELTYGNGIDFSNDLPFSSGYGFKYIPTVDLYADALAGDVTIQVDVSRHPNTLDYGNVIEIGRSVHHIDDIQTVGDISTLTIRPQLRRNYTVADDSKVSLRPHIIGEIKDPQALTSLFDPAHNFQPGSVTLNEVIDERLL